VPRFPRFSQFVEIPILRFAYKVGFHGFFNPKLMGKSPTRQMMGFPTSKHETVAEDRPQAFEPSMMGVFSSEPGPAGAKSCSR